MPQEALSAPVLFNGRPIGIASNPDAFGGATFNLFKGPDENLSEIRPILFRRYASIDVINRCDTDLYQGVFYLEADGMTWLDLARRVPSGTRAFLPVAQTGDFRSMRRAEFYNLKWRPKSPIHMEVHPVMGISPIVMIAVP
jgi:hypothetical protein